jgi:hypothetical protein
MNNGLIAVWAFLGLVVIIVSVWLLFFNDDEPEVPPIQVNVQTPPATTPPATTPPATTPPATTPPVTTYTDGTTCDGNDQNSVYTYVNKECKITSCNDLYELEHGVCKEIVCDEGKELKNNVCKAIVCDAGRTLSGNKCVIAECDTGEYYDFNSESCEGIVCPPGLKLYGNVCNVPATKPIVKKKYTGTLTYLEGQYPAYHSRETNGARQISREDNTTNPNFQKDSETRCQNDEYCQGIVSNPTSATLIADLDTSIIIRTDGSGTYLALKK